MEPRAVIPKGILDGFESGSVGEAARIPSESLGAVLVGIELIDCDPVVADSRKADKEYGAEKRGGCRNFGISRIPSWAPERAAKGAVVIGKRWQWRVRSRRVLFQFGPPGRYCTANRSLTVDSFKLSKWVWGQIRLLCRRLLRVGFVLRAEVPAVGERSGWLPERQREPRQPLLTVPHLGQQRLLARRPAEVLRRGVALCNVTEVDHLGPVLGRRHQDLGGLAAPAARAADRDDTRLVQQVDRVIACLT
jgi:hypothetical protein